MHKDWYEDLLERFFPSTFGLLSLFKRSVDLKKRRLVRYAKSGEEINEILHEKDGIPKDKPTKKLLFSHI